MAKEKRNPSFDTMVKYFLQNFDIPTQRDFKKINTRLDRLENLIAAKLSPRYRPRPVRGRSYQTACTEVMDIISRRTDGVSCPEIKRITGYDDKKIRNLLYRLDKLGKIQRVRRGVYAAARSASADAKSST